MSYLIELISKLFLSFSLNYFKTFGLVLFRPATAAKDINFNYQLPLPPEKYVVYSIMYILSAWALKWYLFHIQLRLQNLFFSIIFGLYIFANIYLFGAAVWLLGYRRKTIRYNITAYAYILGTFLPLALISIELCEIISLRHPLPLAVIFPVIFLLSGLAGFYYLGKFLNIIQGAKIAGILLVIGVFTVLNYLLTEGFKYLIDIVATSL